MRKRWKSGTLDTEPRSSHLPAVKLERRFALTKILRTTENPRAGTRLPAVVGRAAAASLEVAEFRGHSVHRVNAERQGIEAVTLYPVVASICSGKPMTAHVIHRIDRLEIDLSGECIYCGALAKDVELTDEHIIPFSLGGKAVIREGSCKECARETAKLENEIAHKVLWDFRAHVKSPTRRKKSRPTELPFTYSIAGGERLTKSVPIVDHPFFTPMPVLVLSWLAHR